MQYFLYFGKIFMIFYFICSPSFRLSAYFLWFLGFLPRFLGKFCVWCFFLFFLLLLAYSCFWWYFCHTPNVFVVFSVRDYLFNINKHLSDWSLLAVSLMEHKNQLSKHFSNNSAIQVSMRT